MHDRGDMFPADDMLMILPWHAAGTLSGPQANRIDAAIGRDAALARHFDLVRQERAATIALNESLEIPSPRALLALFAAIDLTAEAVRMSP